MKRYAYKEVSVKFSAVLLITTFLLNGCISSSYLASVGAKATHGSVSLDYNDDLEIPLIDSERTVGSWALMHGLIFPYMNLYPDKEGYKVADINFNYQDISWKNPNKTKGTIQLEIKGEQLEFVVTKEGNKLNLINEYRDWYGYPMQGLLVVTIPLDIVIGTIGGVVMLIAAPFIVD